MTSAFCFCPTRWRHKRTSARFPKGNTAHETNRVSPEHIEFIGLLYFDKSHVPCSGVCKEWEFTSLSEGKKRPGKVRSVFLKPCIPKLDIGRYIEP